MAYFPCYVALLLLFSFHSLCYSRRRHCCMYIHFPAVLGKYFEGTQKISAFISFFFLYIVCFQGNDGLSIHTRRPSLWHEHFLSFFNTLLLLLPLFFTSTHSYLLMYIFVPSHSSSFSSHTTHLICFIIFLASFHGNGYFLPLKFIWLNWWWKFFFFLLLPKPMLENVFLYNTQYYCVVFTHIKKRGKFTNKHWTNTLKDRRTAVWFYTFICFRLSGRHIFSSCCVFCT